MSKPKKILIIRNDHIGDLVLSTQVFRELKKKFPKAEISLVVSKIGFPIIKKNKKIDKIFKLDEPKFNFKTFLSYFYMSMKLRKENFDVGIDLRGSLMNSFFLLWLPGIKKRIGKIDNHKKKYMQIIISLLLTIPIKIGYYLTNNHLIKENLEIINKGLNLNLRDYWPEIVIDKKDVKDIENFIKKNKSQKYICLCPVARVKYKQWDLNNWKKLISQLEKNKIKLFLLGVKKDKKTLKKLSKNNKNCKIVIDFDLRKMSVLFKKSSLVIAQDGGPMHISWVSGARTLALLSRHDILVERGKYAPMKNSTILWAKKNDIVDISIKKVEETINKLLLNNI